jgi:hypothetical protein
MDPDRPLPVDRPWIAVCEVAKDETEHAIAIAAEDDDGRIVIRLHAARTYRETDEYLTRLRADHPRLTVKTTPAYRDRIRSYTEGLVGASEAAAATAAVLAAFREGTIAHDGSAHLEEHLFRADLVKMDSAYKLIGRGEVSAHGARAVMFAVWEAAKLPAPTPVIHVRRPG